MPPFIQPSAFFSPLSPAPASSSPPYPAPTRPLPTSPSYQGGSSFPHPPTSPNHGSSSYPMPSAPSSSFPMPSPFSQAQLNNSTPYVQPSSSSSTFRIHPTNSTSSLRIPIAKRKTDMPEATMELSEPQRKVHLSEELVAQNMADLHISHPKAKVARRNVNNDVAEAMNLSALEGLEERFSHQAAINATEEMPLPPQRSRKLPSRRHQPQLRLSIHQELKSMRTPALLPDSIMARLRPSPRTGSTAVVLWKPPPASGSLLPDLVSSALRNTEQRAPGCGRHRTRCYSEVTSTPYSSHENLNCSDSDMPDLAPAEAPLGPPLPCSSSPVVTAEAPELSYGEAADVPPGVSLQRRNSAPEMSEPAQFVDHGSMEL